MDIEMVLAQKQQMQMRMTPQMLQSIEILQLQMLALEERIYQELSDNPVLEILENTPAEETAEEAPKPETQEESSSEFEKLDEIEREWETYNEGGMRRRASSDDGQSGKMEAIQNTAGRGASLQDYLYEQYRYLELTDKERELGRYIIYNLDRNGYLPYALEEIITAIPEEEYTLEEAAETLKKVQQMEPAGIAARNLSECILLQLDRFHGTFEVERELVENHITELMISKLPKLSRKTGISLECLQDAVEMISTLNPKPGLMYSNEPPQYIMPDVVVEKHDNEYIVFIPDRSIPRLQVSPMYRRILGEKSQDPEARRYIKKKISSARWLMDAIEQRNRTLLRISEEVVKHQTQFFEEGIEYLQPLMMQQVAETVGIHVSTVSRAVNGKYIQTPRGIFPLKYFFARGYIKENGAFEADKSILIKIQNIIENEDKENPLSDEAIAKLLKDKGINIARRTITKYRKLQRIESSRDRRIIYQAENRK